MSRAFSQTVSLQRAAAIVGCSPATVLRIAREGNVRALKDGRYWHVDLLSIYEFELRKQREVEARAARRG